MRVRSKLSRAVNLTAANAGHIAPYLNGRELVVANGFPLGVSAYEKYPDSDFTLAACEQLTLMTAGVVKSRATNGELHELPTIHPEQLARTKPMTAIPLTILRLSPSAVRGK